jgi:hypothetical protein
LSKLSDLHRVVRIALDFEHEAGHLTLFAENPAKVVQEAFDSWSEAVAGAE